MTAAAGKAGAHKICGVIDPQNKDKRPCQNPLLTFEGLCPKHTSQKRGFVVKRGKKRKRASDDERSASKKMYGIPLVVSGKSGEQSISPNKPLLMNCSLDMPFKDQTSLNRAQATQQHVSGSLPLSWPDTRLQDALKESNMLALNRMLADDMPSGAVPRKKAEFPGSKKNDGGLGSYVLSPDVPAADHVRREACDADKNMSLRRRLDFLQPGLGPKKVTDEGLNRTSEPVAVGSIALKANFPDRRDTLDNRDIFDLPKNTLPVTTVRYTDPVEEHGQLLDRFIRHIDVEAERKFLKEVFLKKKEEMGGHLIR